jgi:Zn-dependent protease with chaperone function
MSAVQVDWIPARSFGGGAPATGVPAEVAIVGADLSVRHESVVRTVPISALRVREVGTGRMGIELAWDDADGAHAVQVFDQRGLASLRASAQLEGSSRMQDLRASQRRAKVRRTAGWILIAIFLALPILLVLMFIWQADRIATVITDRIPIPDEIALGEQAFAAMRPSLELQQSGAAVAIVSDLGQRLTRDSRYTYRFHVAKDAAVNAFALPGGIVVVYTGLIEATRRPEELAGVLAHEVQHVELRHSLRGLVKDLGLRGLWLMVTGDVTGASLSRAALEITSRKFSREAEAEADARGFDALVGAGIAPGGMTDFFSVMSERGGMALPAFLSTHPADGERQQLLRRREAVLGTRELTPLRFGPWPPK